MELTNRERLARLLQGQEIDRVPFIQYDGMAPNHEVWDLCGRNRVGLLRWCAVYGKRSPNCRTDSEVIQVDGCEGRRNSLVTPRGTLTEVKAIEPALHSAATREHFVKRPEDYAILHAYLRDCEVVADESSYRQAVSELGDDGLPLAAIERTPFQQLWVQWVCLTDLCVHLVECPDMVQPCIDELDRIQRAAIAVVAASDVPFIDFADNISAPIIGRRYFERFCLPYYRAMVERFGAARPVFVHMDGDLLQIADLVAASGIRGIDSLSPPPDNDTSAAEAHRRWPWMRLWLNFPSSQHLLDAPGITRVAREILDKAGHTGRLSIQISENPPPGVWRKSYPAIVRAIDDFGVP